MDLFTQIKMGVSVKEAAEYYGLEVNRGSMVCCPFHADRTLSMKLNEDYFYCFGCRGPRRCDRPCGKAVQPEQL